MTYPHSTELITRPLAAPVDRVFAAFASAEARAIWTPPSPELNMVYEASDFRVGGRDLCVCGPGPAEGVSVETTYHAIAAPTMINFTEVLRMGDAAECATLVTVALSEAEGGTQLDLILQITALGSADALDEIREGWGAALENLAAYLAP